MNLGNGVALLLNARNMHSAPSVARAMVEVCAVPAYLNRQLVPRLAKGRAQQSQDVLQAGIGVDRGVPWGKGITPVRTGKLLDALEDKRLTAHLPAHIAAMVGHPVETLGQAMRILYSALAEASHPNLIALQFSAQLRRGGLDFTLQPEVGLLWLRHCVMPGCIALDVGGRAGGLRDGHRR